MIPGGMSDLTIPDYDPTHDPDTSTVRAQHLPECYAHHTQPWHWQVDCICEPLQACITRAANEVAAYAEERLIVTKYPNRSEDITAALRIASERVIDLRNETS